MCFLRNITLQKTAACTAVFAVHIRYNSISFYGNFHDYYGNNYENSLYNYGNSC